MNEITDLYGQPIDPYSNWYRVRREFREYLETESPTIKMEWDRLAAEAEAERPCEIASKNRSEASIRAAKMSPQEHLERNRRMIEERRAGALFKELAYRYGVTPSRVRQICR